MGSYTGIRGFLYSEACALLSRLNTIRPFAVNMPMVSAASIPPPAWRAIERHLSVVCRDLNTRINEYIRWLGGSTEGSIDPSIAQRRFVLLKLRFNFLLDQLDIFADVLTQRSEHVNGVWLAGLDRAAEDGLILRGRYYKPPPVVCYLDRGHGAAIRRARTRLPGGRPNPVAIIRIPRERMVGSGIASSLFHEVGHQGSVLLDLINSMRQMLREKARGKRGSSLSWGYFERCISEILADFWALAKLGVTATLGLMGVVSLPRWFVFRINMDDPHPFPWIRVKLNCAMGRALFSHPQWDGLAQLWERLYPRDGLDRERLRIISLLEADMPGFVHALVNHKPPSLRGRRIKDIFPLKERTPQALRGYLDGWNRTPGLIRSLSPSLVFAVLGQARMDGRIRPLEESALVSRLLVQWALRGRTTGMNRSITEDIRKEEVRDEWRILNRR